MHFLFTVFLQCLPEMTVGKKQGGKADIKIYVINVWQNITVVNQSTTSACRHVRNKDRHLEEVSVVGIYSYLLGMLYRYSGTA